MMDWWDGGDDGRLQGGGKLRGTGKADMGVERFRRHELRGFHS